MGGISSGKPGTPTKNTELADIVHVICFCRSCLSITQSLGGVFSNRVISKIDLDMYAEYNIDSMNNVNELESKLYRPETL